MELIKLHNLYFKKYIAKDKIAKAVSFLSKKIKQDCKNEIPLFIAILNGSFIFASDLLRSYTGKCEISFLKLASYNGLESTKKVNELIGINENLENRTVIILEDIIDTGTTVHKIYEIFKQKNVKQLKVATLFFKPDVFKKELHIDYIGINIPDEFIVGYGLDFKGLGRNYPDIYQLTKPIMKNIVLFGPPGAGKGTQSDILKDKFKLIHISTGVIFRENIKNKTKLGILAKKYIDAGDLVPDKVTIDMLKEEIDKNENANGFIFDGFPRTKQQAKSLDIFLGEKGERINGMIALEVPEKLLIERLLERGKTSGRSDDVDIQKIKNRFNEYNTKTDVLKKYYQEKGIYFGVNGVGSIKEITERLITVFDKL